MKISTTNRSSLSAAQMIDCAKFFHFGGQRVKTEKEFLGSEFCQNLWSVASKPLGVPFESSIIKAAMEIAEALHEGQTSGNIAINNANASRVVDIEWSAMTHELLPVCSNIATYIRDNRDGLITWSQEYIEGLLARLMVMEICVADS